MGEAADLADQYDAMMAEVVAVAEACSGEEWRALCTNDERTVGVVFDHIAEGNSEVVLWIKSFLADKPVEITPEVLHARNAQHAHSVEHRRPMQATIDDLKQSAVRTSTMLRGLTEKDLRTAQDFGWAGRQEVAWVAGAAVRHPRGHLKNIREALGR
jgi:hypothetical protein